MSRVYASHGDLVDYFPESVTVPDEPEATRVLTRASERVDIEIRTALYDVDDDGMPTDAAVIEALKLATCAQVLDWTETDDELDMIGRFGSVTAGQITISGRGNGSSNGSTPQLCKQAMVHLRLGGLTPGFVISYG